jgi:hypothetical protein
MKSLKVNPSLAACALGLCLAVQTKAQVDPNFHIYLAFGQSNMEGNSKDFNATDKLANPRFQVLAAVSCASPGRTKDKWAPGIAPLARCNTGLTPADYFARTLIDSLPSNIKIGIALVAVGGTKIEGFDLSTYKAYYAGEATWMQNYANEYGGNPYGRLVAMAKEAQKSGVIKGILLHQGESNTGDATWPSKVSKIYSSLLNDLGLKASNVPLLAGEVVNADQGGACAGHNNVIAKLPQTIPTSYVISSKGCPAVSDKLHFTSAGYRELGKRYATQMLKLLKTGTSIHSIHQIDGIASGALAVYDVRGSRVAEIKAMDAASIDREWNGIRRNLPVGIYWMKDRSTGNAWKLLNGR